MKLRQGFAEIPAAVRPADEGPLEGESNVDGNYGLDLKAIMHHVETAETLSFFFPVLRRALIIDLRGSPKDAPLVKVAPMARSASDRLRSLKRMRPNLPRPTEIVAIPWPQYVDTLVGTGVWERLARRLAAAGAEAAVREAHEALQELRQHESRELGALIRGEQYETIWARRD